MKLLEYKPTNKNNIRRISPTETTVNNAFNRLLKTDQFKKINKSEQKELKEYLRLIVTRKLLTNPHPKDEKQQILVNTLLDAIKKAEQDLSRAERDKRKYFRIK